MIYILGGIKVLSSPGIKKKREPGSNHVEYIGKFVHTNADYSATVT